VKKMRERGPPRRHLPQLVKGTRVFKEFPLEFFLESYSNAW